MTNESPPEGVVQPVPSAAYGRLSGRAKAILIDAAISAVVLVLLVIVGSATEDIPGSGRVLLVLMFGWALLYEPLQVWWSGSTIGHRRANLRVVSDKTGDSPSFAVAFLRFLIKAILGLPSFVSMLFTRRYQAIHDLMTGTTVQLRDLSIAREGDYLLERTAEQVEIAIPASRSRRVLVTLLYIVAAYVLSGLLSVALVSAECLSRGECSTTDRANSSLVTYLFLAAAIVIAVQGLRGRLRGARSQVEVAPLAPSYDASEPPPSS